MLHRHCHAKKSQEPLDELRDTGYKCWSCSDSELSRHQNNPCDSWTSAQILNTTKSLASQANIHRENIYISIHVCRCIYCKCTCTCKVRQKWMQQTITNNCNKPNIFRHKITFQLILLQICKISISFTYFVLALHAPWLASMEICLILSIYKLAMVNFLLNNKCAEIFRTKLQDAMKLLTDYIKPIESNQVIL